MKLETQTEQLISETVTVYGLSPQIGVHALAQTANALAAQGTVFSVCPDITEDEETDTDIKNEDMQDTHETSASVSVQIAYPEYVFKSRIHKIEKLLKKACKKYNINLVAVPVRILCSQGMQEWMVCSGSRKKKNRNLRLVLRRFS